MLYLCCNDTASTNIYTLSLHDALPISERLKGIVLEHVLRDAVLYEAPVFSTGLVGEVQDTLHHLSFCWPKGPSDEGDRKSTRLNSSHSQISYAVFCLKKKILPETVTMS